MPFHQVLLLAMLCNKSMGTPTSIAQGLQSTSLVLLSWASGLEQTSEYVFPVT